MTEPYDRVLITTGERPLSTDIAQLQSNAQSSYMSLADYLLRASASVAAGTSVPLSDYASFGFLADSFQVYSQEIPSLLLTLQPGLGLAYKVTPRAVNIGGFSGTDDVYPVHPIELSQAQTIAVPTPSSVHPRYDIIEVEYDIQQGQNQSRDVLDPSTGTVTATSVPKVMTYDLNGDVGFVTTPSLSTTGIGYVQGTPAADPSVPPNSPGYITVAVIYVATSASSITQGDIVDMRPLVFPGSLARVKANLSITTDGTNVSAVTGDIQAPPGVKVAAWFPSNLVDHMKVAIIAGGSDLASVQWRSDFNAPAALTATAISQSPLWFWDSSSSDGDSNDMPIAGSDGYSWAAPFAGTFKNLTGFADSTNFTGPEVITVDKNGVAQTPTITIPSGGISAAVIDNTHSFSFAQGDLITVIQTGGSGATTQSSDLNIGATLATSIVVTGSEAVVTFGDAASDPLSSASATDMSNIGSSIYGVPGAVYAYGDSTNGQPVLGFQISTVRMNESGTYALQFEAYISTGAES